MTSLQSWQLRAFAAWRAKRTQRSADLARFSGICCSTSLAIKRSRSCSALWEISVGFASSRVSYNAPRSLRLLPLTFAGLRVRTGIYPREPRNRKKANKGSSAPASFYYSKDIQYLLHEPVLGKLREHKAFAKKLSRAIGRGEWGLAKNLEESKPVYRIDHIIKER